MLLGSSQIAKISSIPEEAYGQQIVAFDWLVLGIVTGGSVGGKSSDQKLFGIGSDEYQGRYTGKVENDLSVDLVAPTADILNTALTRTLGELASYNWAVGVSPYAWTGYGLKWDTLSLDVDADNPLKASLAGIFKTKNSLYTVGPEYQDPGDIPIWQPEGLVLEVEDIPDTELVACSINVRNNLKRRGVANSSNDPKRTLMFLSEGSLEIDATIQTLLEPTFDLEGDCPAGIDMVLVFTDLCGGATPDTLTITLTDGQYVEKRQPLKPGDAVDFSIGISFASITIA